MLAHLRCNFSSVKYVGPRTCEIPPTHEHGEAVMQLGLEFSDPGACAKAIDTIVKVCPAMRIIREGNKVVFHEDMEPLITDLPQNMDWKEACDCTYMRRDSMRYTNRWASICANDKRLLINLTHHFADGGYFLQLIDLISNNRELPSHVTCFPVWIMRSLPDELEKVRKAFMSGGEFAGPDELTRIKSKKDVTELVHMKYFDVADVRTVKCHVKDLQCYDKSTGKCSGLTESLWMSLLFSASAWNNKLERFGMTSCVDQRRYIKDKLDPWEIGSGLVILDHYADCVPNESLKDLAKRLRTNFNERFNGPDRYTYFGRRQDHKEMMLELSNVGRVPIKEPLTDVWMLLKLSEHQAADNLALLSWTIDSEVRNDLFGQLRYAYSRLTNSEAELLKDSVKFCLEQIPLSTSVQDAFNAVRDFQDKHRC